MLLCEFLGSFEKFLFILGVLFGEIPTQWMLWLWIIDQRGKSLNDLIRFCCGFPVFWRNDGQTDLALLIDIRVVNLCFEGHLGRLEWILSRKTDFNFECTLVVGWLISTDKTLPKKYVRIIDLYITKNLLIGCSDVAEFFGQSSGRSHCEGVG